MAKITITVSDGDREHSEVVILGEDYQLPSLMVMDEDSQLRNEFQSYVQKMVDRFFNQPTLPF